MKLEGLRKTSVMVADSSAKIQSRYPPKYKSNGGIVIVIQAAIASILLNIPHILHSLCR